MFTEMQYPRGEILPIRIGFGCAFEPTMKLLDFALDIIERDGLSELFRRRIADRDNFHHDEIVLAGFENALTARANVFIVHNAVPKPLLKRRRKVSLE
jgi:hypothetical protein